MLLKLHTGLRVKTIGDPHLGRNFNVGTPISRKGEREQSQLNQLGLELMDKDCDVNIMMGDIFDKFSVSPTTVMQVYSLYTHAATSNPHVDFILIRGNHDVSRDEYKISSFDLLVHMLRGFRNIYVVEDMMMYTSRDSTTMLLICGYDAFMSTAEMIDESMFSDNDYFHGIFGHWEVESFGGDDHNLCPLEKLGKITDLIVTGHIHTPDTFYIDGQTGERINKEMCHMYDKPVEVVLTGSMQPYTHGEDPDHLLYVTKTLQQYEKETTNDPSVYHDKCLRLLLEPEDDMPENIDCLQFTYKVVREGEDEELEVTLGDFDFKELFMECLEAHGVDEEYRNTMWETYMELQADVEES